MKCQLSGTPGARCMFARLRGGAFLLALGVACRALHGAAFVRAPHGPRTPAPTGQRVTISHATLSQANSRTLDEQSDASGGDEEHVSSRDENLLTQALRVSMVALASSAAIVPEAMDAALAVVWNNFHSSSITQNCMFEAHVAVASFFVWIVFFETLHLWLPNASKYRLDGKPPVKALEAVIGADIYQKAFTPVFAYLATIAVFHYFGLGQILFGAKPEFDAPSFLRVLVEVPVGIFLYDLVFFPIHYSLHRFPVKGWSKVHQYHHSFAREQQVAHNATETVVHSYVDGALQVATNILVQQISPWGCKHPLSRAIHNIVVTYLLCESHSGYDLPFMSHRVLPWIFGGSPRHEAHHQVGNAYYQQFFKYLDDALGTIERKPQRRSAPNP